MVEWGEMGNEGVVVRAEPPQKCRKMGEGDLAFGMPELRVVEGERR